MGYDFVMDFVFRVVYEYPVGSGLKQCVDFECGQASSYCVREVSVEEALLAVRTDGAGFWPIQNYEFASYEFLTKQLRTEMFKAFLIASREYRRLGDAYHADFIDKNFLQDINDLTRIIIREDKWALDFPKPITKVIYRPDLYQGYPGEYFRRVFWDASKHRPVHLVHDKSETTDPTSKNPASTAVSVGNNCSPDDLDANQDCDDVSEYSSVYEDTGFVEFVDPDEYDIDGTESCSRADPTETRDLPAWETLDPHRLRDWKYNKETWITVDPADIPKIKDDPLARYWWKDREEECHTKARNKKDVQECEDMIEKLQAIAARASCYNSLANEAISHIEHLHKLLLRNSE